MAFQLQRYFSLYDLPDWSTRAHPYPFALRVHINGWLRRSSAAPAA